MSLTVRQGSWRDNFGGWDYGLIFNGKWLIGEAYHHIGVRQDGSPALVSSRANAVLWAMAQDAMIALRHQAQRNHEFSDSCDACAKASELLNEFSKIEGELL